MSRRGKNIETVRTYGLPIASMLMTTTLLTLLPPYNVYIIVGAIALLALTIFAFARLVTSTRDSTLAALFVMAFLSIGAVVGFNLINTILLLSFIIGLRLLLQ